MIRTGLIGSIPPILLILGFALWGWVATPPGAEIAVHFGLDGQVNRYGTRLEAFGLMPALALGLTALFAVLPVIDPRGGNLRRSPAVMLTAWLGGLWVMALAQAGLTLMALGLLTGGGEILPRVLGAGVAVLYIALGNVLPKARPNWFVGVRTPWTLSSDRAWDVSHRWAARLFVAAGLGTLLAMAFAPLQIGFAVLVGGALTTALISVFVSYWVWKHDPERETYTAAD